MYWNKYKTKAENKNTTNKYKYFLESNFVGVNRLFVLIYSNQDDNAKRFRGWRYYLLKHIINNYNVIIIDSDIKRYEEIKKLTTRQVEDYSTVYLLDYDYIKNHYKFIAFDLGRQK